MNRAGRYLAGVLAAMLLAPAIGMVAAPYETTSVMEHRVLRAPPSLPRSAGGWAAFPRALDDWFADHFAWRGVLVKAAFWLQAKAGLRPAGSLQVVRGKGDWLLLYPGLLAATGGETSPASAARYGAFVCDVQRTARAHGAAFLFAPAPANVEIYPEAVPDWIPRGSPNQPDLVLSAARACGAATLDLRPAMRAAKAGERLYQHHDSHWTNAGALVAFNGVARAFGQPWTIDPARLGWRLAKPFDSDLVRLAGAVDLPQELAPEPPEGPDLAPESGRLPDIPHGVYPPPFIVQGGRPGPTVLIIGDSYAADFVEQYFRRSGVTLAWIHQADCGFDRRIFDRAKPDFVVLMPAARLESCR
jgi:hypothetical protein